MHVALFLTVLSTIIGFAVAASPAAYAARSEPSKRYGGSPVIEARAPSQPSGGVVRRAQPSARYAARQPAPEASKRAFRRDMREQTAVVSIDSILCPYQMSACPVNPAPTLPKSLAEWTEVGHECVEFDTDLQSCGGCASIDKMYVAVTSYHPFTRR